ncbi:MAG: hypothetical protein H6735_10345 [Alphaproteobacteria bacterium]|nr:hypothetical protein [Alphaproteobacteria bacterium]
MIGQRVGPFEIVEPAVVPEPGRWWVARRTGSLRKGPDTVLVRVLDPDADDAARTELQRSYDLLRGIEDPRVPEPVAFFEGMGALAVSAVSGASLLEAIEARSEGLPLSEATIVDLLLEVGETLQRAHHRNRAHGHLDPSQVVLSLDGGVWIFGFGHPDAPLDRVWAPPERLRGEPAGPATDQWSLAVLAAGLVTGEPPRSADGTPERPDPAALASRVDARWPAMGRLVRRMLDPNPAQRYPSLQPVRQELLGLSRRSDKVSDRRDLAAMLLRRRPEPEMAAEVELELTPAEPLPPPDPEPPEPEAAPQALAPAAAPVDPPPPAATPAPAPVATATPGPAARRTHQRLPEEQIPVVRPHLVGDVPIAGERRADGPATPPPAPVAIAAGNAPFGALDASSVDELESGAPASSVEIEIDPVSELEVELSAESPLPEDAPAPPQHAPEPVRAPASPWKESLDDEQLVTSPTVVPLTESDEEPDVPPTPTPTPTPTPSPSPAPPPPEFRDNEGPGDPPSQSEMWFASAPATPDQHDPSLGLDGIAADVVEPALAQDDGPSEADGAGPSPSEALQSVPITRIAPVLAGALVLLLVIWAVLRLL